MHPASRLFFFFFLSFFLFFISPLQSDLLPSFFTVSLCPQQDIHWGVRTIEEKERKVGRVTGARITVMEEKWLQQRERWRVGYKLKGRTSTEIEIEEEINKGNPFSPDIGFHTDVVLLSGSIHLRHNAGVSSAHTTFTLNKSYSLLRYRAAHWGTVHTMSGLLLCYGFEHPTCTCLNRRTR